MQRIYDYRNEAADILAACLCVYSDREYTPLSSYVFVFRKKIYRVAAPHLKADREETPRYPSCYKPSTREAIRQPADMRVGSPVAR